MPHSISVADAESEAVGTDLPFREVWRVVAEAKYTIVQNQIGELVLHRAIRDIAV